MEQMLPGRRLRTGIPDSSRLVWIKHTHLRHACEVLGCLYDRPLFKLSAGLQGHVFDQVEDSCTPGTGR
jgi:hypothetical protein